jgi:hypothetical protein
MNLKMPQEVIEQASKCPYNFECLQSGNGNYPICKVDYADGKNILFLKEKKQASCPYRITYGLKQVCSCPVYYFAYAIEDKGNCSACGK